MGMSSDVLRIIYRRQRREKGGDAMYPCVLRRVAKLVMEIMNMGRNWLSPSLSVKYPGEKCPHVKKSVSAPSCVWRIIIVESDFLLELFKEMEQY